LRTSSNVFTRTTKQDKNNDMVTATLDVSCSCVVYLKKYPYFHIMKRLSLLLFLFSFVLVNAQNKTLDSLLSALKKVKSDTNKVCLLIQLGAEYYQVFDYNTAKMYTEKAIKLAQMINYASGIGKSQKNLGDIALNTGDLPLARTYYTDALKTLENIHSHELIGTIYNNIGVTYFYQSQYPEALKNYSLALKLNKAFGNKKQLANTYNNFGAIYQHLGNYPEALKYLFASLKLRGEIGEIYNTGQARVNIGSVYLLLKKYSLALQNYSIALKLVTKLNDKKLVAQSYNGIGTVYSALQKYPQALNNYVISLKIFEEIGDLNNLARAYHNVGSVYDEQDNFTEAFRNYFTGLQICEKNNFPFQISASYSNIGNLLIKQRKFSEASNYLSKGLSIAKGLGQKEDIKYCYLNLARLDSIQGNYKQAYIYRNLYYSYRDSLINEANTEKIIQSQMQFEFDKKETIMKAEQEKKDIITIEEKKRDFYISLGLGILLLFSVLFAALFIRQNKLKAQQQSLKLEQKLLRLQMNPHFIFNSLIAIESFIHTKQPDEAREYLADFAKLMRLILENSREEYVSLQKEIDTLNYYLRLQKLTLEDTFTYSVTLSKDLDTEEIQLPPMLIQPFIENAIKHGVNGIANGHIEIVITKENENLIIEIKDNGKGIFENEKDSSHTSLATTITKERLLNINLRKKQKIDFRIQSLKSKGTQVIFTIPL
jgi:tetratricopeptide (TPR) repeat protein/two-component sensor histidine kinase